MPMRQIFDSLTCRLDQQSHSIVREFLQIRISEKGLL